MDAICLDDWELLPDQPSFFMEEHDSELGGVAIGGKARLLLGAKLVMVDMDHFAAASHRGRPHGCVVLDEEAKKPLLLPSSRDVHGSVPVTESKDIGVVHTGPKRAEAVPKVTEIAVSADAEEGEEEVIEFPDGVKEVVQDEELAGGLGHRFAGEVIEFPDGVKDGGTKKIGFFSVGNLRVHGVGALCSFGVAAATFCIVLLGGGRQRHRRQDHHKTRLQMYTDDQRLQRVMQQASRLNQTVSSVTAGGGGASSAVRASISFGGRYHGF